MVMVTPKLAARSPGPSATSTVVTSDRVASGRASGASRAAGDSGGPPPTRAPRPPAPGPRAPQALIRSLHGLEQAGVPTSPVAAVVPGDDVPDERRQPPPLRDQQAQRDGMALAAPGPAGERAGRG